jgi:circadian clock protein KaiB
MSKLARYKFRLYVAGDGPHSNQAISNLKALCSEYLPERHEIEIIDVFREPKRALTDGVVLTPMTIKISPLPIRKIVGCLSQVKPALLTLDLAG